jgi:hypothetical protein
MTWILLRTDGPIVVVHSWHRKESAARKEAGRARRDPYWKLFQFELWSAPWGMAYYDKNVVDRTAWLAVMKQLGMKQEIL